MAAHPGQGSVASCGMSLLRRVARRVLRRHRSVPAATPAAAPAAWAGSAVSPWAVVAPRTAAPNACLVCRWEGEYTDGWHAEFATCPQCGSVARDRFLLWCYISRNPEQLGVRLLETSPRMGEAYRTAMGRWFDYLCSDYDLSAHKGVVQLDLQAIARPDASFDVILTPHVLEHVPDTGAALREIYRVLAPGGRMYLQVPLLQGHTAPPTTPEFHGDNTPVFWRFGFDLVDHLRAVGFQTSLLCTAEWLHTVRSGATDWPTRCSQEFDVASMLAAARVDDLVAVADDAAAARFGFQPAYMHLTWECVKPLA